MIRNKDKCRKCGTKFETAHQEWSREKVVNVRCPKCRYVFGHYVSPAPDAEKEG
jgi:DNA-directed RNA polymerase subunit RPC12/RpoP